MMHFLSARSKLVVLHPFVLAFVLSQIAMSAVSISNYGASTAMAMSMNGTPVKYLNLFLPNGTKGYIVISDPQKPSQCVKEGITTQKWDKTMFTLYPNPLAGGSQVTVRAFTKSDCSDNPPSQTFRLPYDIASGSDTCRLNLLNTRVNGCLDTHGSTTTSTIIVSVNTMIVYPPANGTAVKFTYNKKPKGICQDTKPLSWDNTFITHNSVEAGSKIEFTAYTGDCKHLGTQLVDNSFNVPAAGTIKNPTCWINLQPQPNGAISGCNNGY